MSDTITVQVEPDDVDVAVEQFLLGASLKLCCPVARALQAHVERVAVVFKGSWHLDAQDKVPATKGVALPAEAVAYIAAFDTWAKAVHSLTLRDGLDLDTAKATALPDRPGALQFSTPVPE